MPINLSFRKPLDVRMEWVGGGGKVDQVAVYRQGQNDGKLIAHKAGMLGSMVGTLHLDIHDSRAMEDSKHPITEVGLGYIIERAEREIRSGRLTVGPAAPASGISCLSSTGTSSLSCLIYSSAPSTRPVGRWRPC